MLLGVLFLLEVVVIFVYKLEYREKTD